MFWWLVGFLCRYFWVVFIAGEVSMNACLHGSKWASPLHGAGHCWCETILAQI